MAKQTKIVSESFDLSGRGLFVQDCSSIATTVGSLKQVTATRVDNRILHVDIDLGGLSAERRDKVLNSVRGRVQKIVDHKVDTIKEQKIRSAMAVHAHSTID